MSILTKRKQRIDEQLSAASVALENASANDVIRTALSNFGYTGDRLQQGKALYSAALNAQLQQKADYGDQRGATVRFETQWKAAKASYVRLVKIARVVFKGEVGVFTRLGLAGKRQQNFPGWLAQAEQFYTNLLNAPDLLSRLAAYGITTAKLEAAQAEMYATQAANLAQEKEKGDAQQATKLRDAALGELNRWLSDFVAIARIALEDTPQLLESLGIRAPS